MSEFLETTVDKFTFKVATDRFYTAEGVWAKEEDGRVRIGLSDFVQQRSGDVAFAEVKPAGTALAAGDEVAVIETIKVNISLHIAGERKNRRSQPGHERCPGSHQPGPVRSRLAGRDGSRRLGGQSAPNCSTRRLTSRS